MKSTVNATVALYLSVIGQIRTVTDVMGRWRTPEPDTFVHAQWVRSKASKPLALFRSRCCKPWLLSCPPDGWLSLLTIVDVATKEGFGYLSSTTHYNLLLCSRCEITTITLDANVGANVSDAIAELRLEELDYHDNVTVVDDLFKIKEDTPFRHLF